MEAIETREIKGVVGYKKVSWGNFKNHIASQNEFVVMWNDQDLLIEWMRDFIEIMDKNSEKQ